MKKLHLHMRIARQSCTPVATLLIMLCCASGLAQSNVQNASANASASANTSVNSPATKRPKVALVLSGGGARGAAHIGVIKVLEELRIPIDIITGTSMGALVGASYASGTSISELEERISKADWDTLFTDTSPREDRSFCVRKKIRHVCWAWSLA